MPDLTILVLLLSGALLLYGIRRFGQRPASWINFTEFCYALMFFGGYIVVYVLSTIVPVGSYVLSDVTPIFTTVIAGFFTFVIFARSTRYLCRSLGPPRPQPASERFGTKGATTPEDAALYALGMLSLASIAIFIAIKGISIGNSSYERRYEISRGAGPLIFFFPSFLPAAASLMYRARRFRGFLGWAFVSVAVGFTTYLALAGYRQILMACMLTAAVIAVRKGYVSRRMLVPFMITGLISILALSFLRYAGEDDSVFDTRGAAASAYLQGDVFPIIAPLRIYEFTETAERPGIEIVTNALGLYIPRFLWPKKPDIMQDAAGYYTQEVRGYGRGVTLSPTVIGEGLLVGGTWCVYLFLALGGVIVALLNEVHERTRSRIVFFNILAFQYSCFFFLREGLSILALRVVFLIFFVAVCKAIKSLIPVRVDHRFA
jgi:hypothetical protein